MVVIKQNCIFLFTFLLLVGWLMWSEIAFASHAYGGGPSGNAYDGGSGVGGMTATTNSDGGTTVVNRETGGGGYLTSTGNWTQWSNSDSGGNGSSPGPTTPPPPPPPPPPPSVNLTAQINPDTTQYRSGIFITPDDEITLEWGSTNASSCTNNFGAPNSTSGTFDITPGLTPGEDIVYSVTCTGAGGSVTSDITVTTPDIIATTFEANPRIVRSGETTTFEWELELSDSLTLTDADDLTPYSYECTIRGATPDGTTYTFDAADNDGSGSVISRTLTSKYTNRLQCDTSTPSETEVEVVPSVMEI